MLRHLHVAVLLAILLVFTNAVDFPEGFLRPRQNPPLVSGGGRGDEGATTPPTTPPTTRPTLVPTTTSPSPSPRPTTTSPPPGTTPPSPTTTNPPPQSTTPRISQTPTGQTTRPTDVATSPANTNTLTSGPSIIETGPNAEVTVTSTNLLPIPETTLTFTSDGQLVSSVATGTGTQPPTSTSQPGLASDYGSEKNTLSAESRKLIGGIVGGVGGALLMAGIAFAVYKIWGRKKHTKVPTEEEYFSPSTDSIAAQKDRSGWGASSLTSKFSEPLDRYKSPGATSPGTPGSWGGSLNKASNF